MALPAGVDKFAALRYIAQGYRIPAGRIAAIGDDVNDLGMIKAAGLGAAMPDAAPSVRDAADRTAEGGHAQAPYGPFVQAAPVVLQYPDSSRTLP